MTITIQPPPIRASLSICAFLAVAFLTLADPGPLLGEEAAPKTIKNSLGMQFKSIEKIPVLVSAFETRVVDFETFVKESKYPWALKPHFPQTGEHPVVNVNLKDARLFCTWLTQRERAAGLITELQTYRLPTPREWDAIGGLDPSRSKVDVAVSQKVEDEKTFPWGLEWPPPQGAGNFNRTEIAGSEDGFVYTAPVGRFDPTPDGLYDVAGNVWEWTYDPEAPPDAPGAVRGGSWMYFRKDTLLSSYVYAVPVDLRASSVGFRCVLEDKHRSAIYLADQEMAAREREKVHTNPMAGKSQVSAEDVKEMREKLARRTEGIDVGSELPDPATLKPAKRGEAFVNSLGMTLRPVGTGGMLMGETEVRVQDYLVWLKAAKREWTKKPTFDIKSNHPVVGITWNDAVDYCKWLTERDRGLKLIGPGDEYRLPTDQEWSLAVGLPDETGKDPAERDRKVPDIYPWGGWPPPPGSANIDSSKMRSYQDNFAYTAAVASFSPNAVHLYDMGGNAAEWCSDPWPGSSGERVVRGSSWLTSDQDAMLSSARQHLRDPDDPVALRAQE